MIKRTGLVMLVVYLLVTLLAGAEGLAVDKHKDTLDKIRESISSIRVSGELAKFSDDSLLGRLAGTRNAERAAKMIEGEFERMGLSHLTWLDLHSYRMSFPLRDQNGRKTGLKADNIVGLIRGEADSDKYIIVGSHYDFLGGREGFVYNGADDAAGIVAVLEIARLLKKLEMRPRHHIIFVLFSGSMMGYQGAFQLAAALKEKEYSQLGMLYLHRLGGKGGEKIDVFTENYPGGRFLTEAVREAGNYYKVDVNVRDESDDGSDAMMFTYNGIPAVGINWDWQPKYHPYYGSDFDTVKNTDTEGLIKTISVAAGSAWLLANKE